VIVATNLIRRAAQPNLQHRGDRIAVGDNAFETDPVEVERVMELRKDLLQKSQPATMGSSQGRNAGAENRKSG
jgi:hypothetical protein